jgi:hypothetical protein
MWRKWIKRVSPVVLVVAVVVVLLLRQTYRPALLERPEIFRGIHLTVESASSGGRIMLVEIAWNEPGIELVPREFTYPFTTENPNAAHYQLSLADWSLHSRKPAILVNTTRYFPSSVIESLPGRKVRTLETVVADGKPSHVHPHSYLLFWDEAGQASLQETKPPSAENLSRAVHGLGIQGIQISKGRAHFNSMSSLDDTIDRTFVGIDPIRNLLFLIALEKSTGYEMIEFALRSGVVFGGQVDSGGSTTLLIGPGSPEIKAHTGIRNWRPLGPYLMVFAEPLGGS